jgi:ankyrin repeat protein
MHRTLLRSCDTRLIELLLNEGADVNVVDAGGNTPLLLLTMCPDITEKSRFVDTLLKQPAINVSV